jgi:4-diphosphocytidyl-2-C-methyl-D-erythritol kinase
MQAREIAPAKLNLALHVRGRLPDGRHSIETIFAFCTDGDRLSGDPADDISLEVSGDFEAELRDPGDNLVVRAARALAAEAEIDSGAALALEKNLPVAAGVGGGSADAGAALRLLTSLWQIAPKHAEAVAPRLGSDVPACLLSVSMRGEGVGDQLTPVDLSDLSGTPVLLVNPRVALSTAEVFSRWDGLDQGPLEDWREGFNGLERFATALVPQIETVLAWLTAQRGSTVVRMSGSGATCFAMFDSKSSRDNAAELVPREWWRLATFLR